MGEVLREQNDLESAERYLQKGFEIGKSLTRSDWLLDGYVSLIRLKLGQGDMDAVPGLIEAIRRSLPEQTFTWHRFKLSRCKCRFGSRR